MWDERWDEIFKNNEWGKYPPEELIRFIAINFYKCPDRSKVKILEIGSGTGANLWYMAREGFDVTGVDGSNTGVERSQERLKAESLNARVLVGDVVNLPFNDNSFECVIDIECLCSNSFKDTKKIVSEIYRVLKPQGKFFSKTFMTGSEGDGAGEKVSGEKNTYADSFKGTATKGCGIIRFTDEDEISQLYGKFKIESIDYITRSKNNRAQLVKEWIIACVKEK